jgi:hypothetical protein
MPTADSIIHVLDLQPHPEGGFYREMFRDSGSPGGRSHLTAIYYLLREGEVSHWHRVMRSKSGIGMRGRRFRCPSPAGRP